MPNWVYNHLDIEAIEADPKQIDKLVSQLNQPFEVNHDQWNSETGQMEKKPTVYTNPIFGFWNIVKPTDLDTYYGPQPEVDLTKPISFDSDHWYDWNVRHWGTKWDIAVQDDEKYPETTMEQGEGAVSYNFNTAWSPPIEAISRLSLQYPELVFTLSYEEETGWGGDCEFMAGKMVSEHNYENKCRDCESEDTLEYCDSECGEICSACNWLGEADLDAVSECEIHKEYLDNNHIPEYRLLDKTTAN
jgi:hypothetical protein